MTFQSRTERDDLRTRGIDSNLGLLYNPNPTVSLTSSTRENHLLGVEHLFFVSTYELPNPWQKRWWQRWLHYYRMIWILSRKNVTCIVMLGDNHSVYHDGSSLIRQKRRAGDANSEECH